MAPAQKGIPAMRHTLITNSIANLAASVGLRTATASTGPIIYTGPDTYFKLDATTGEAWGADTHYNQYYYALNEPADIGQCVATLLHIATENNEEEAA